MGVAHVDWQTASKMIAASEDPGTSAQISYHVLRLR